MSAKAGSPLPNVFRCLLACLCTTMMNVQGSSHMCLSIWTLSACDSSSVSGSMRTAGILKSQVDMLAVLKCAIQLDNVVMLQLSMDPDLTSHLHREHIAGSLCMSSFPRCRRYHDGLQLL